MYKFIHAVPPVEDFLRLREITGLSPRPRKAAEQALPNSLYCVHVKIDEQIIGMDRVVGDGALNIEIVDVAVDPAHQGQGLGRTIMEHIMDYIHEEVPKGALISLMADAPGLYKKFGFQLMRPESEGMYLIKE